mgnify:CR=1 FL=1
MTTNFDFLKKIDKNLYTIINEAEMLYRDEYFDDMLATLKDNITGEEQEREFIDDLYFLKN